MTTHSTLFHFHTSPSNPFSSSSSSSSTTNTPHLHLSCSFKPKPPKPSSSSSFSFTPTPIPARDRVIDFGKHKGKMLGTLPSTYLKWVSTNLRARDFEHWAHLADQVLNDAVYRDRIEWESAENALSGNRSNAGGVSELLAISDRFGWDNDDKVGWSKVNFELLGTSKGGRIPRRRNESVSEAGEESEREKKKKKGSEGLGEKRRERRERRVRMQREEGGVGKEEEEKVGIVEKVGGSFGDGVRLERRSRKENGDEDNWVVDNSKKFPGRESLLRKAYSRRTPMENSKENDTLASCDSSFGKLPDHLLIEIFIRVPVSEWVQICCVRKQWANLFRGECLWQAALSMTFPLASKAKSWPGPIPRGLSKRRFAALYVSQHIFALDGEMDEIVGHTYLFLKEQLELSSMPPPSGILHGTMIDQFIACGKSRDMAHELASQIWLAVLDNLEETEHTFQILKRLAQEGDVFLPYPYSRSIKVQWKVFEKLFTDFRDCLNYVDYYDVLACAKNKFQPIPSIWLGH